jgi:hypothetical protein
MREHYNSNSNVCIICKWLLNELNYRVKLPKNSELSAYPLDHLPAPDNKLGPRSQTIFISQSSPTFYKASMSAYTETVNRAVVYSNPPTIESEVVELSIPQPGPGEVLVRLYVDCCRTQPRSY